MPFYIFQCPQCKSAKEVFFKMADEHLVICQCGKRMKKDFHAMGAPAYFDVPINSVDTDLTGEPIVYHTRGQLKEIAKQHGCTVDFGKSHVNHHEYMKKESLK